MRIDGSIPIHVARAYAAAQSPGAVFARPPAPAPASAARPVAPELIAAKVDGPVDFATPAPTTTGAYQLYTRAADRIEAAVAVELGRSIDVKG